MDNKFFESRVTYSSLCTKSMALHKCLNELINLKYRTSIHETVLLHDYTLKSLSLFCLCSSSLPLLHAMPRAIERTLRTFYTLSIGVERL